MRNQIETALKEKSVRLTSAIPYRVKHNKETKTITYEELKTIQPMEMAEDVFLNKYGNQMPDTMKSLLQNVIEEAMR